MADQPKPKPKTAGDEGGGSSPLIDAVFWILLVLVAYSLIKGMFGSLGLSFALPSAASFFEFVFDKVQIYSVFLSLVFFIGIIYFNFKLGELAHQSHHRIHGGHGHGHEHSHEADEPHDKVSHAAHSSDHHIHAGSDERPQNRRWKMVEARLSSGSEGDRRLALIEADIILQDMLTEMHLPGSGIAEKLKMANRNNFRTLDDAWEAHKIRNRIAHEGAAFHLSEEDAKRAINLYKRVFDEFYFI
ncbi:MAG: hypothetical protein V4438_02490 [Patescibacteria group bacterium]